MSGRCPALVLMLGATMLSSGVVAFGAQRSGPKPAPDPALGDGGVSAFYVWDQEVPARLANCFGRSRSRIIWY